MNKYIVTYISIIVSQGDGIVTTLEHLKYFFLRSNGDELSNFNLKNQSQNKGSNTVVPKLGYRYNPKNGSPHNLIWTNQSHIYEINVGSNIENKEAGKFNQYEMYNCLCTLGSKNPAVKSKYMMLAAILRGYIKPKGINFAGISDANPSPHILAKWKKEMAIKQKINFSRYCVAAIDTLNFAQSVASTSSNKCSQIFVASQGGGSQNIYLGGSKNLSKKYNKNYNRKTRGKANKRRSKTKHSKLRRNRAAKRTNRRRH